MTEAQYQARRTAIMLRISRHDKRLSDGRYLYPRCLAADYRELDKLDKEYYNEANY